MTTFAIFANDAFWGIFSAETADEAIQAAADEFGTDGNTDGMTATEVTEDQATAVEAWWENGADAGDYPLNA